MFYDGSSLFLSDRRRFTGHYGVSTPSFFPPFPWFGTGLGSLVRSRVGYPERVSRSEWGSGGGVTGVRFRVGRNAFWSTCRSKCSKWCTLRRYSGPDFVFRATGTLPPRGGGSCPRHLTPKDPNICGHVWSYLYVETERLPTTTAHGGRGSRPRGSTQRKTSMTTLSNRGICSLYPNSDRPRRCGLFLFPLFWDLVTTFRFPRLFSKPRLLT